MPESVAGPEANALAKKMLTAIQFDAWQNKTSAVSWTFRGDHKHFWDKNRGLVQVEWDNYRIQFNKHSMLGIAFKDGKKNNDPDITKSLVAKANAYFVNDAFWLNPLFHINSPGTSFELIESGVLLVRFKSGGVTPGDTYVFYTDDNFMVKEMRLWVSIVPFKGIGATFKNYQISETGVHSATFYEYIVDITISDINMSAKYPLTPQSDIFKDFHNKSAN